MLTTTYYLSFFQVIKDIWINCHLSKNNKLFLNFTVYSLVCDVSIWESSMIIFFEFFNLAKLSLSLCYLVKVPIKFEWFLMSLCSICIT